MADNKNEVVGQVSLEVLLEDTGLQKDLGNLTGIISKELAKINDILSQNKKAARVINNALRLQIQQEKTRTEEAKKATAEEKSRMQDKRQALALEKKEEQASKNKEHQKKRERKEEEKILGLQKKITLNAASSNITLLRSKSALTTMINGYKAINNNVKNVKQSLEKLSKSDMYVNLKNTFSKIKDSLSNLIPSSFTENIETVFKGFGDSLSGVFSTIGGSISTISKVLGPIAGTVGSILGLTVSIAGTVFKIAGSIAGTILKTLKKVFNFIKKGITTVINITKKAINGVAGLIRKVANSITGMFSNKNTGINEFGDGLKGITKNLLGFFSVYKMIDFGKETAELGSSLSEVQNVVETVFPSMTEAVEELAEKSLKSFGLSKNSYKDYISTMGALFKSAGFGEEQGFDMSKQLVELAADVASLRNMENSFTQEKMTAVITGQTRALRQLGADISITTMRQFAYQKGAKKTYDQMSQQEKIVWRFKKVLNDLGYASGDFERTSRGWANSVKQMKEAWANFKATLGQGFINALLPMLNYINQYVLPALQSIADKFKMITAAIFGDASQLSSGVSSGLNTLLENKADELEESAETASKALEKAVLGFDELNILGKNDSEEEESPLSTESDILGQKEIDTSKYDEVRKKIEEWVNKIKDFFNAFKVGFKGMFDDNAFGRLRKSFTNLLKYIDDNDIGNHIMAKLGQVSGAATSFFVNLGAAFNEQLLKYIKDGGDNLIKAWDKVFDNFSLGFKNLEKLTKNAKFQKILYNIIKILETVGRTVATVISTIFKGLTDLLKQEKVLDLFSRAFEGLAKIVSEVGGYITSFFENLFKYLNSEAGQNALKPLIDAFTYLGDKVNILWEQVIKPFFDKMSSEEGIQGVVNVAVTGLSSIITFIGDVFQGVTDVLSGTREVDGELSFGQELVYAIYDAFGFVKQIVGDIIGAKDENGDGVYSFKEIIKGIPNFINEVIEHFKTTLSTIGQLIGAKDENGDGIYGFREIINGIPNLIDKIKEHFDGVISKIGEMLGAKDSDKSGMIGFKEILEQLPDIIDNITSKFNEVLGVVSDIAGTIADIGDGGFIGDAIKSGGSAIEGMRKSSQAEKAYKSGDMETYEKLRDEAATAKANSEKYSSMGLAEIAGFFMGKDKEKEMKSNIKENYASQVQKHKENIDFLQSIPFFAAGGYVKANQPQLAVVGDNKSQGEYIAPENDLKQAIASAVAQGLGNMQASQGKNTQPIMINFNVDGQTFYTKMVEMGLNTANSTGNRQFY